MYKAKIYFLFQGEPTTWREYESETRYEVVIKNEAMYLMEGIFMVFTGPVSNFAITIEDIKE